MSASKGVTAHRLETTDGQSDRSSIYGLDIRARTDNCGWSWTRDKGRSWKEGQEQLEIQGETSGQVIIWPTLLLGGEKVSMVEPLPRWVIAWPSGCLYQMKTDLTFSNNPKYRSFLFPLQSAQSRAQLMLSGVCLNNSLSSAVPHLGFIFTYFHDSKMVTNTASLLFIGPDCF
jgi:hypothetical protein